MYFLCIVHRAYTYHKNVNLNIKNNVAMKMNEEIPTK